MNNEKWQRYLDSAQYPATRTDQCDKGRNEIKKAVLNIPIEYKDKKILLLGCGAGYEVQVLREAGFTNLFGTTYDRHELKHKKDDSIIFSDMHELDFEDNTFDFIYSKEVLEHSLAPYIALCELNRVLKVNGEFVHYIAEGEKKQTDWYHFSCFRPFIWVDLFHLADCQITKIQTYDKLGNLKSMERAYWGRKLKTKNWDDIVQPYDLDLLLKNIKYEPLEL